MLGERFVPKRPESMFRISKAQGNAGKKKGFLLNDEIGVRQNVDYSLNARQSHHQELLCASKILSGIKIRSHLPWV